MTDPLDHSTRYDLMKSDQVPADELAAWLKEPGFAAYVEGRQTMLKAPDTVPALNLDADGLVAAARECARITAPAVSDEEFARHKSENTPTYRKTLSDMERTIRAYFAGCSLASTIPAAPLPDDMRELIIAARIVAYEDQSPEAIRQLDRSVEKFGEAVAWDNEPEDATSIPAAEPVAWRFKLIDYPNERYRFNDKPPEGKPWTAGEPLYASPQPALPVSDAQIERMVQRFLQWKLPKDFRPDCGISFDQTYFSNHGPVGTNLLDGVQATAMVRHMVEDLPASPQPARETEAEKKLRQCQWYWPEDDTTEDMCADSPQEVVERACVPDGTVVAVARGGVVEVTYCASLPPDEEGDSDDDFWVEEATAEAASAKIRDEIARRAVLRAGEQP